MLNLKTRLLFLFIPLASLFGCSDSSDNSPGGTGNVALGQDAVYEAANGVGPLLIELIRLHLTLSDNDYPLPRYYAET